MLLELEKTCVSIKTAVVDKLPWVAESRLGGKGRVFQLPEWSQCGRSDAASSAPEGGHTLPAASPGEPEWDLFGADFEEAWREPRAEAASAELSRLLSRAGGQGFLERSEYGGSHSGWVFKLGDRGLGYYRDAPWEGPFEACARYEGTRPGWTFRLGAFGLGYYWDSPGPLGVHGRARSEDEECPPRPQCSQCPPERPW